MISKPSISSKGLFVLLMLAPWKLSTCWWICPVTHLTAITKSLAAEATEGQEASNLHITLSM